MIRSYHLATTLRRLEGVMASPKELRKYADECIRWARAAHTDKEREIFLKLARMWLDGAVRLEKSLGIIDEHLEKRERPKA